MKVMRTAFSLAAGLAFAAGLWSAPLQAQTLEEIQERGTVNIGMLVDFPPFGIMNEQNQPDGFDADVAKLLAEDMGVEVNLVPVTGPNRIPYLISNQVDLLVASLGITEERAKSVDFSDPYVGIQISVYGEKDIEISEPEDLEGITIGVARASTQDTGITELAPEGAHIQRFDDDASAVQALLSGQVDVIGCSNTVIAQLEQMAPGRFDVKFDISEQVQGIAVRPGSSELLDYINDFLQRVKDDGRLDEIHQKWLDSPLPEFVRNSAD